MALKAAWRAVCGELTSRHPRGRAARLSLSALVTSGKSSALRWRSGEATAAPAYSIFSDCSAMPACSCRCVPSTEIHHRYTQLLTAMAEMDFNEFLSPERCDPPAPNLMYICTSQGEPCLSLTQCDKQTNTEQIRKFRTNFENGHVTRCSTEQ